MLRKIHVKNYKSLKDIEVTCTGLNLLMGVNGAGKSSFIQVLRMLRLAADKIELPDQKFQAKDFGGGAGFEDICYAYACRGLHRIAISVNIDDNNGRLLEINREIVSRTITRGAGAGVVGLEYPSWSDVVDDAFAKSCYLESRYEDCRDVKKEEIVAANNEAERKIAEMEGQIRTKEHDAVVAFKRLWEGARFVDSFRRKPTDVWTGGGYNSFDLLFNDDMITFDSEGGAVMEFLHGFCHCQNEPSLIERVNQCLIWVSPGARLRVVKKKVGGNTYYVASVDYGVDGDVRMFKPQNVGFGVSYILPVLTVLLAAKRGNVIIIENPEAHLHPRGQSEIGKLIAETVSRGVQVFVETHSDHVVNGIRVAVKKGVIKPSDVNIAFFERGEHGIVDKDGNQVQEIFTCVRDIKVDKQGALSEYPENFMDEWNNQLMKLM